MNKIFKIWTSGWKVIGRYIIFQILIQLLFLPLSLFFMFLGSGTAGSSESQSPILFPILAIIVFIILPLICYAASEILGEFVAPRISRKKLREIEQNRFRNN